MSTTARHARWQLLTFGATWLAYASFYLTRKNYAVAQPAFMEELGWTEGDVGPIITAYLAAYAVGQFVSGWLGDLVGARRMLAGGFAITVALSVGLGLSGTIAGFALLFGLNGFAQSTGWPSVTKAMTAWFPAKTRGRVMGLWGTNYPVGDALATGFAALLLGLWGWRASFFVPAAVLAVIGVGVIIVLRNRPEDVGLPPLVSDADADYVPESDAARPSLLESFRPVANRRTLALAGAYFCLKFVRYTFIFWIGLYLVDHLGFTHEEAGYLQVPFPLAGVFGSIVAGFASDLLFDSRRAPVAVLMLLGLVGALLVLIALPTDLDPTPIVGPLGMRGLVVAGTLALCGFFVYGPDMLIAGTAAMDFGSVGAAARVAGFVNGVGSIGAALSGVVVGSLAGGSWGTVFILLIAMVIGSAGVTATLWFAKADS